MTDRCACDLEGAPHEPGSWGCATQEGTLTGGNADDDDQEDE